MSAKILVMEGPDRLGKSTQVGLFVQHLLDRGFKVARLKSPINDRLSFRLIYWMLRSAWARKLPNVFQVIQFLNKLLAQWVVFPYLARKNDFIVLDRWGLSMWAYGISDGASVSLTKGLLSVIQEPDFTFVFIGNPHIVGNGDSYEADATYQERVKDMYKGWLLKNQSRSAQINANQPVQDVHRDVLDVFYWF